MRRRADSHVLKENYCVFGVINNLRSLSESSSSMSSSRLKKKEKKKKKQKKKLKKMQSDGEDCFPFGATGRWR